MMYDRIRVAIIAPTREAAINFLRCRLGDAYSMGKVFGTPRLIYENPLMEILWIAENNINITGMRFHVIFCTPEIRESKWFNDHVKRGLYPPICFITEEDLTEIEKGEI